MCVWQKCSSSYKVTLVSCHSSIFSLVNTLCSFHVSFHRCLFFSCYTMHFLGQLTCTYIIDCYKIKLRFLTCIITVWHRLVCYQSQLYTAETGFCCQSPAIIYFNYTFSFQRTLLQKALPGQLYLLCLQTSPCSLIFLFQKTCFSYWWIVSLQEVSLLSRWARGLGEHTPDWSPSLPP